MWLIIKFDKKKIDFLKTELKKNWFRNSLLLSYVQSKNSK